MTCTGADPELHLSKSGVPGSRVLGMNLINDTLGFGHLCKAGLTCVKWLRVCRALHQYQSTCCAGKDKNPVSTIRSNAMTSYKSHMTAERREGVFLLITT